MIHENRAFVLEVYKLHNNRKIPFKRRISMNIISIESWLERECRKWASCPLKVICDSNGNGTIYSAEPGNAPMFVFQSTDIAMI